MTGAIAGKKKDNHMYIINWYDIFEANMLLLTYVPKLKILKAGSYSVNHF